MAQRLLSLFAALAVLLVATGVMAQPIPVEGTEMVPNEHGDFLPREITWGADGAPMVLIPFGTFRRGLNERDGGRPGEDPAADVYLPSFYIDKYEVSHERYNNFVNASGAAARPISYGNPGLMEPSHPVIGIPWESAERYARWAGKELPTEAMWEKAARGPRNTLFTTGNTPPPPEVVIHGRGSFGLTVPVDQNTGDVSGYGVFHMNGNVSEFVQDWFMRDYYKLPESRSNPKGPAEGETRVFRGGSYFSRQDQLRLTTRNSVSPILIRDQVGFRTVWVPRLVEVTPTPTPTPTPIPPPTRAELTQRVIDKFQPYLERGVPRLPREMLVSPAQLSRGTSRVQFVNFTPFRVSLTFVEPDQGLVYLFDEPLPEMSFRNVNLPNEADLVIVGYAPGTRRTAPFILGNVRAESRAIVVLRTQMFAPVVTAAGVRREVVEQIVPEHYYDSFTPRWNEVEVFNPLADPLVVALHDITVGSQPPTHVGDFTVEPGEALLLLLNQGRYRFTSSYFGALGDSGTPVEVRVNDRAARRLLILSEDKDREGGVMVVTRRRPFLKFDLREASIIPR